MEECLKMSRFKHSHIMGLIGVCLDTGSAPFIVMPYMANGSLLKYLRRERENIVLSEEKDKEEVNTHCHYKSRFPYHWLLFYCIIRRFRRLKSV